MTEANAHKQTMELVLSVTVFCFSSILALLSLSLWVFIFDRLLGYIDAETLPLISNANASRSTAHV
jgi:hypothetical protein